jgi:hypothetical protein
LPYIFRAEKNAVENTQKIMLSKFLEKNENQSIMLTTNFFDSFGGHIFIFGHFINVQFSKQPINNDSFPRLLRLIDFPT